MNSIPCDVVLLPNEELALEAITTSQIFANHDPLFTLQIGKFYPHMSLYMFQLNESDIPKVEGILHNIADTFHPVQGTATNYSMGEGLAVGYVGPEYEAAEELLSLQKKVIDSINPIRAGMRASDAAKMKDATDVKLDNLKKYGYPAVGSLFRPHITLTRLKDYSPELLRILPDISRFNGLFDSLGLFEMGANGTCIRKIAEYNLTK